MSPQMKAMIAARIAEVAASKPVNTPKVAVNTDRHKPGYMREYMRKRRLK